ncbi:MAG: 4'-phosphopantetheinyl transferase superfamily protein [Cyanobium sp.]
MPPRITPLTPSRWPLADADAEASGDWFPQVPAAALGPTLLLVDRRDPAISAEERRRLLAGLSSAERERLQRYRQAQDADRFLLGRGLMRRWLAQLQGCSAGDLPFTSLAHGKPMVAGAPQFNVSHSGDLILLGLHRERAVGVDLEQDRARLDWQRIARRFLGEAALEGLRQAPGDETTRRQAFLLAWCGLEARLKAEGRGLRGLSDLVGSAQPGGSGLPTWPWDGACWPLRCPEGYQGAAALQTAAAAPAPPSPSDQAAGGRADASTASGPIHIASP